MKKIIVLTITLITVAFGQLTAQKVNFKTNLKTGDSFKYYLFHNKYNPKNKDYKRNVDTVVLNFEVLSTSNLGSIVSLTFDYSKQVFKPYRVEGLKKVVKEAKQTPIELSLDVSGKYLAIKNWQTVKQVCLSKLSKGKASASSQDKETWEYWKTKVQTEEQIEKLFISDIEFLFMLFGSDLVKNKAFDYEDEMTYGSDNLPANTHLTVSEDSLDKSILQVELFTLPDAKKANNQLNRYRQMAKEQADNPDSLPLKSMFDLQDFYKYSYNTSNNMLKSATYLRYTRKNTKGLVEEWFLKLKP